MDRDAPLHKALNCLISSGALTAWQADRLPGYVRVNGFSDLWANPYFRAVREHTRAHVERLFEEAASTFGESKQSEGVTPYV